jgi:hypothetical protein
MTAIQKETAMRMASGDTVPAANAEEAKNLLAAFFEACGIANAKEFAVQITKEAMRFAGECKLRAVGFSDIIGMQTVHFVFETDCPEEPFDYESEYGCFCYVYNLEAPHCSEYGFCGFKHRGEALYRVW